MVLSFEIFKICCFILGMGTIVPGLVLYILNFIEDWKNYRRKKNSKVNRLNLLYDFLFIPAGLLIIVVAVFLSMQLFKLAI